VSEVFGYDDQTMQMVSQKAGTVSPYTNRMNLTYSYNAAAGQMGVGSTAGNAGQLMGIVADSNNNPSTINGATESASYTYDANGNVTNDGSHSYSYDSENRLVYVDVGATASYAYDHANQRYKATVGSAVTHYLWRDGQVIAEHNGSTGAVLVNYIYGNGR